MKLVDDTRIPPSPYPELRDVLKRFVTETQAALGDNLLGIYLVGSEVVSAINEEIRYGVRNKHHALASIAVQAIASNLDAAQQAELVAKLLAGPETVEFPEGSPEWVTQQFLEAVREGNFEKARSLCHPEFLAQAGDKFSEHLAETQRGLTEEVYRFEIIVI